MLTLKTIFAVMRQQRSYGDKGGACFGVNDPRYLRPRTTPDPPVRIETESPHADQQVVEASDST